MIDFLRSAEEQLKFNKDKLCILSELGDHVETKRDFFESIGYDEKASAEKANEAMGDGTVVGQRLNQIHSRKRKAIAYLIFASAGINIALNALILFMNKSNYFIPFAAALFILLCNLAFSYTAIKFKSGFLSAGLMAFSFAAIFLSAPYLAYPLCNLIIADFSSDPSKIYSFSSITISICFGALVFLPNVFNIYHCMQIKRLKNTKKQNHISKILRNACILVGILISVLSNPYYAMNNSLCKEQARIRDELMDFAFETANGFNFADQTELEDYLENSKYDFEYVPAYGYIKPMKDPMQYTYVYCVGNWQIEFDFYNPQPPSHAYDRDGYSISIRNNTFNVSQRYLVNSSENNENIFASIPTPKNYGLSESPLYSSSFRDGLLSAKLSESLSFVGPVGRPYSPQFINIFPMSSLPPIPLTDEDIRNTLNEVSLLGVEIVKNSESTEYIYTWQGKDVSNNLFIYGYDFYCEADGTCTGYYLTEDYSTLK